MVSAYPFKTLNLIQEECAESDIIFNTNLLKDISKVGLDVFTRYIFGQNLSRLKYITKVYSWSEFQDIERSFNFGIQESGEILVIACQFLISSKIFFHLPVREIDVIMRCAPDKVLVNGPQNLRKCKGIKYDLGVSLRYNELFKFSGISKGDIIIVLGSFHIAATRHSLKLANSIGNYLFKGHPDVRNSLFSEELGNNLISTDKTIYDLFCCSNTIITSASGTAIEAVACGLSVIIVAKEEELISNPLIEFGKGKIWDLVFTEDEIKIKYQFLSNFRKNNPEEIKEIATWYKCNFFVEPTETNILKVFS